MARKYYRFGNNALQPRAKSYSGMKQLTAAIYFGVEEGESPGNFSGRTELEVMWPTVASAMEM